MQNVLEDTRVLYFSPFAKLDEKMFLNLSVVCTRRGELVTGEVMACLLNPRGGVSTHVTTEGHNYQQRKQTKRKILCS